MEVKGDDFYITLFSDASSEIYTLNAQPKFTNRLALPVDIGSSSDWLVGLAEISYKPPQRMIVQGALVDMIGELGYTPTCRIGTQKCIVNHHFSVTNRSTPVFSYLLSSCAKTFHYVYLF